MDTSITVEKLTADPLKLVSYPVSDDDAPVKSEASLTSQINKWTATYNVAGFVLAAAAIATVVQILVMIGHYMAHSYYYEPQPYEPLIPWLVLPFIGIFTVLMLLIANDASKRAEENREKLYRSILQGRIVAMDRFGNRPHVQIEGRNSRNETRTEWHKISEGEWENWLFKYMKRGIYVDFRTQESAGEQYSP